MYGSLTKSFLHQFSWHTTVSVVASLLTDLETALVTVCMYGMVEITPSLVKR